MTEYSVLLNMAPEAQVLSDWLMEHYGAPELVPQPPQSPGSRGKLQFKFVYRHPLRPAVNLLVYADGSLSFWTSATGKLPATPELARALLQFLSGAR